MTEQILVERKDINKANKLESDHKIPREYKQFRDTIYENLRSLDEVHCKTYVPQLYQLLRQSGLSPQEARVVVIKDGTEMFRWSPITIDKWITEPEAKNQAKAKAGRISAEVKKSHKRQLVAAAVAEGVEHRGPGRPRKPIEEQIFSTVVDCNEFIEEFKKVAELADKAGTNKAKLEISNTGKLNVSVYLVDAIVA